MTRTAASSVGRVAGVTAIALLQAYWLLQPVPDAAKALAVVFLAVSMARPAAGLLIFAGLAPLSTALADLCGGGTGLGGQMLEQMALSIGAGVLVRAWRPEERTRMGAPALFLAVVAIASAVATIPAAAAPLLRSPLDGMLLHQLATRQTALSSPVWAPLFAALVIAECGLLGWAVERVVRREPGLTTRLVLISLVGHAGAAVLNFQEVLSAALGAGDVTGVLPRLVTGARLSLQTDVHAAASALVLAGIAGFGLIDGSLTRRLGLSLLLILVAVGLWITDSRVAIVLGATVALLLVGWLVGRAGPSRRIAVVCIALLALGAGAYLVLHLRNASDRRGTISMSVNPRLILLKAGLQMFEETPVFGIGIGKFYGASARYIAGRLGENFHENAHNNFIQVLAEQGVVGLGALLWWLGVVSVGGIRAQFARPTVSRGCLLAAVFTCIGTWITGHPLLVPEFAFVFWLYGGVLAATTPALSRNRPQWLPWLLVAGVVVSVAPRASALRNAVEMEHLGFGLSQWQHDDSQRYRVAGASFALYLPATGRFVEVPIRRAPGTPGPLLVEARLRGRLIASITITGEAWQPVLIDVPAGSRRFELVDFAVRMPASLADLPGPLLRIGKAVPRF